jgi:hypothetical protein
MSAPTPKQLAAGQVRTLRTMRAKLLIMAEQWEEVDEYNRTRLTELADLAEAIGTEFVPDETEHKVATKVLVKHLYTLEVTPS